MTSHGYDKLKRVMWRVLEYHPKNRIPRVALFKAIYTECGISQTTVDNAYNRLIQLDWIKHTSRWHLKTCSAWDAII